jgi:diaminohydroxyphosphoribosylaminopyrimidine deaminase/5-amino-6-(5-phosphoribosylamino)uracil reductase
MRRALFHAARGLGRTSPNPLVGAVIVAVDGVLAGQGYHHRAGEPHAEVNALDEAGGRARGSTLYVTLEPCCHVGRTGPCTRRIIDAGVRRVVAAMQDPDPRVSGRGFAELRANGIEVHVGLCEADARQLNQAFIVNRTLGRPLVLLKAATSLDACVAARRGERTAISSREANQKSHRLRASIDGIGVGSETVLVDDPLLTARGCFRERPLTRVIFDRRLRTRPAAKVFSTLAAGPVVIITHPGAIADDAVEARSRALTAAGATLISAASLDEALVRLLAEGVTMLLVEGGPQLQAAFAAAGLVDRVHLVVAPRILGEQAVRWLDVQTLGLTAAASISAEPRGTDIWIEADVHRHR